MCAINRYVQQRMIMLVKPKITIPLRNYGLSLVLVGVATGLTWLLWPHNQVAPFAFYHLAAVGSALYCGWRAGAIVVLIGALVGNYLFIPPFYSWQILKETAGAVHLAIFAIVTGVMIILVEALRRTSERLRESRMRLELAMEAAHMGSWFYDIRTNRFDADALGKKLHGFGADEAVPSLEAGSRYIHPDDQPKIQRRFALALESGGVYKNEYRVLLPDGGVRWIASLGRVNAERSCMVGMVQEFTEHQNAVEALRESEERYRKLVELSPDAILIAELVDQEGIIIFINQAGVRLFGAKTAEDIVGLSGFELLDPRFVNHARERCRIVLQEDRPIPFAETRLRKLDGTWVDIEVSSNKIMFEGKPMLQATYRDISERKRMEQQVKAHEAEMEQLQQGLLVGQTVAAIAHELNQPLNAVTSYNEAVLRLLRAGNLKPEKLVQALNASSEQAHRAGQVMRDLLTLLQAQETAADTLDLAQTIHRAIQTFSAEGSGRFTVTLDAVSGLPPAKAVAMHVEKALLNLLRNGVEAMRGAGLGEGSTNISVQPAAEAGFVRVSVRDYGPGIDPKLTREIFEPFYTTKTRGVGVGLAISRTLIEAQGGKLWLDPDVHPGACFHFTVPLAP